MKFFTSRKRTSGLALAIALATGSAVVATAVFPTEAQAQRKKKKDKEEDGGGYSDEWTAAYRTVNDGVNAEGADVASFRPQMQQLAGLAKTQDEMIATGGLVYNTGIKLSDRTLQLQGMEMMLASGKVPPENVARYNYIAYQLSNNQNDLLKARKYLQGAIDNNFTTEGLQPGDLQLNMSRTFFDADENAEGLGWLASAITARESSDGKAPEQWYSFAFSRAFNASLEEQSYDWALRRVAAYPTQENWLNAINVVRQFKSFGDGPELDLLRLVRKVDSMTKSAEFMAFVDAANATLTPYPKEVKEVIEEGYATGNLDRSDPFYSEVLETVTRRLDEDLADLPGYIAEARQPAASATTVVGAANASLSYGDYATAIELYDKALPMTGVDRDELLNRKGIAQVGMGDYTGARTTLGQVGGSREAIADLWVAYVSELESEAGGATAAADGPVDGTT